MKAVLSVGALLAVSSPALAAPGLTLEKGAVNATLTIENEASAGEFGDTASLAPDISVGVTDNLTLGLVTSSYARTNTRGGVGGGICAVETCDHTYDNAGVAATYSLRTGALSAAAETGMFATSFDDNEYMGKVGARVRYKVTKQLQLQTLPNLAIAMNHRGGEDPSHDKLYLPVSLSYLIGAGIGVGVSASLKAPLDDMAQSYEGGFGTSATYKASDALGFGASLSFGRMIGGDAAMEDTHGLDVRTMQLWMSVTQ